LSGPGEDRLRTYRSLTLVTIGLIMVVSAVAIVLTADGTTSTPKLLVGLLFSSLFSGAATALVFTTMASRETEQQLDLSLDKVLRRVFLPFRTITERDAVDNYQWSTHLTLPDAADPNPGLGVQLIRLAYTREPLPSTVSVVCIASMDDSALSPYAARRYLLRWQIDPDLDPGDTAMFSSGPLLVNGHSVEASVHDHVRGSTRVCEYRYSIPRHLRTGESNVSISIRTRKEVSDLHVPMKVLLFSNVTQALFSCTVDPSIHCKRLSVATNISALGPRGESWAGPTYPEPYDVVAAHARFNYALQAGSSVTFYIDRRDGMTDNPNQPTLSGSS